MDSVLDFFAEAGAWAALAMVILAAVQHTILADWWKHRMGRSLMLGKLSIVAILLTPLLSHYVYGRPLPPETALLWVEICGRWLVAGVYAQRIFAREIRRRRLSSPPPVLVSGEGIPRSARRAREGLG